MLLNHPNRAALAFLAEQYAAQVANHHNGAKHPSFPAGVGDKATWSAAWAKTADETYASLEASAKAIGYTVVTYGLYPSLQKDGKDFELFS